MKLLILALLAASAGEMALQKIELPGVANASVVATGDFNHDARPDLAIANLEGGEVTVLLNDGGGRFHPAPGSPFQSGSQPNDFAVDDFNHDGNPDLAVVNTQTPFISIFLGDGKGGFRAAPGSPVRTESHPHPHGVVAGDFSGRGAIDLMTDSWGHNQIEMLRGDGHGAFSAGPFFNVGKRPYQRLRSADLNGDGKPDLVTTNLDGDSVTVLLGDGHGGFREAAGSPFKTAPAPWEVAIADIDRDGKPDLAIIPYDRDAKTRGGASNVTVLLGDGTGRFTALKGSPFSLGSCAQPTEVAAADLTAGPLLDIAVTCPNSGQLALLTPAGGGYRLDLRSMPGQPYGLTAADFFGNHRASLAVSDHAKGTITLLRVR
ncbi:MAG TPA: VCBS repeat-containing protein [Bryobacteraceae bacterium]|nr:VCBS repeat-containing protein [Bryobacteraceae bacterium]